MLMLADVNKKSPSRFHTDKKGEETRKYGLNIDSASFSVS